VSWKTHLYSSWHLSLMSKSILNVRQTLCIICVAERFEPFQEYLVELFTLLATYTHRFAINSRALNDLRVRRTCPTFLAIVCGSVMNETMCISSPHRINGLRECEEDDEREDRPPGCTGQRHPPGHQSAKAHSPSFAVHVHKQRSQNVRI